MSDLIDLNQSNSASTTSSDTGAELEDQRANVTFGSDPDADYITLGLEDQPFEGAKKLEATIGNPEIARRFRELLNVIVDSNRAFKQIQSELPELPPLHAHLVADESLQLAWISDHYRVGFEIGPESDDTSWFIVTDDDLGAVSASGHLVREQAPSVVLGLIKFLLSNA